MALTETPFEKAFESVFNVALFVFFIALLALTALKRKYPSSSRLFDRIEIYGFVAMWPGAIYTAFIYFHHTSTTSRMAIVFWAFVSVVCLISRYAYKKTVTSKQPQA